MLSTGSNHQVVKPSTIYDRERKMISVEEGYMQKPIWKTSPNAHMHQQHMTLHMQQ